MDSYNDYFSRAYKDVDLETFRKTGAMNSFSDFRASSKTAIDNTYYNVMFDKSAKNYNENLSKAVFDKIVKHQQIGVNSAKKLYLKAGQKISYNNKEYRGGQFLPKNIDITKNY